MVGKIGRRECDADLYLQDLIGTRIFNCQDLSVNDQARPCEWIRNQAVKPPRSFVGNDYTLLPASDGASHEIANSQKLPDIHRLFIFLFLA